MPLFVPPPDLPITACLDRLTASLEVRPNLVLEAPPGAGKTTIVPLALLEAPWRRDGRIVMLEPRRLAARLAARRMASLLGEAVGETVGYRVRQDTRVGPATRIEIVTDGVFGRMIREDPSLAGIAAILFDEFHERRIESDLGLALALETQEALRPDLRLVVMSATLDAGPVASLLGEAPRITTSGRAFPVECRHRPAPKPGHLAAAVIATLREAVEAPGDILVFLPGTREIRQVERSLADLALGTEFAIAPLFGDLIPAAQDRAIAPAAQGRRKIVLATSIAETSLTIEGIRQVIDAGVTRRSRFDPRTGLTRLETVPVSQATAEQRAGRAGRTAAGICWRLWPAAAQLGLRPYAEPEIMLADLTPLVLDLAAIGIIEPARLRLLDPPPTAALAAARTLLQRFEAVDDSGRITPYGISLAELGLPPRLAHMVRCAVQAGDGSLGVALATLLTEPDRTDARSADIRTRLERLPRDPGLAQVRDLARRLAARAGVVWGSFSSARAGALLALAFPDRVAQRRGNNGRFLMSGGQGAILPTDDPLAAEPYLVVAELDGQVPDSRIWSAAPITEAELEAALALFIMTEAAIWFDNASGTVQARRHRKLGSIILGDTALDAPDPTAVTAALIDGIRSRGLGVLPWSDDATALRTRVGFLARRDGDRSGWPGFDDAALAATLQTWLAPTLGRRRSLAELATLDLCGLLRARLESAQLRELDRRAPSHLEVPSGSRIPIDYHQGETPILAVRLQEMFGLAETPRIDDGRVPVLLHLLSPAHRPVQVTSDLGTFWRGSYKAVRADLRGRYPKHFWPEDPLTALPTARAKPRGT